MKKYIGAVLRKSSQLKLAAEIGSFDDLLDLQKIVHKNFGLKKTKLYTLLADKTCNVSGFPFDTGL